MISEELGYVGFAADIYGAEVGSVEDQDTRIELVTLYRSNNTLFYGRIQAAVDVVKNHPDVMPDKIAVIGCKSIILCLFPLLGMVLSRFLISSRFVDLFFLVTNDAITFNHLVLQL